MLNEFFTYWDEFLAQLEYYNFNKPIVFRTPYKYNLGLVFVIFVLMLTPL